MVATADDAASISATLTLVVISTGELRATLSGLGGPSYNATSATVVNDGGVHHGLVKYVNQSGVDAVP